MADIETTVNAMAKKDTSPPAPEPPVIADEVLAAVKIQAIVKELAQPWFYGTALHTYARRHGVQRKTIIKIYKVLKAKQAADAPVQIEEVP